jgi:hypothetical protein
MSGLFRSGAEPQGGRSTTESLACVGGHPRDAPQRREAEGVTQVLPLAHHLLATIHPRNRRGIIEGGKARRTERRPPPSCPQESAEGGMCRPLAPRARGLRSRSSPTDKGSSWRSRSSPRMSPPTSRHRCSTTGPATGTRPGSGSPSVMSNSSSFARTAKAAFASRPKNAPNSALTKRCWKVERTTSWL